MLPEEHCICKLLENVMSVANQLPYEMDNEAAGLREMESPFEQDKRIRLERETDW